MGLFDFFKPKKDPVEDVMKTFPVIQKFMASAELDKLQAQVANLMSVGRADEAKEAADKYLKKYVSTSKPPFPSAKELALISYKQAYQLLPALIHKRWEEFHDLWNGVIPFPIYLAIKGASESGHVLSIDQIQSYKFYEGEFDAGSTYYLFEFPAPPITNSEMNLENILEMMKKGQKPSLSEVPVLGPYLFAAIVPRANTVRSVYVLGQSGPQGSDTTVRFVSAEGAHGRCNFETGPDPTPDDFLAWLYENHQKKK